MQRRAFLSSAAVGAFATAATPQMSAATAGGPAGAPFVDTNVTLGHWVVRHASLASPAALVGKLRQHGVTAAWTGSFEGVLQSDIAGANARLADACAREGGGVLLPFGTLNPTLPDWEDDLRRCADVHRMRGVRLFPSYHGYTLDDPRFKRLLDLAGARRLLVQIAINLEDERSQNPALTAPPVAAAPLVDALAAAPGARVMLLNATSRILAPNNPLLQRLAAAGVILEIATLEGAAGIETLLRARPDLRLTCGSHTQYFYFEAALLKLQESELTAEQLTAVRHATATAALDFAGAKTSTAAPSRQP